MKFLLKSTNEFRFETLADAKAYQEVLREQAAEEDFQLASYSWTEKGVKAQGEIIDTYYVVKAVCVFNEAKDPEKPFSGVDFEKTELDEVMPW